MLIKCKQCGQDIQAKNTPPSILTVGHCDACNINTTVNTKAEGQSDDLPAV